MLGLLLAAASKYLESNPVEEEDLVDRLQTAQSTAAEALQNEVRALRRQVHRVQQTLTRQEQALAGLQEIQVRTQESLETITNVATQLVDQLSRFELVDPNYDDPNYGDASYDESDDWDDEVEPVQVSSLRTPAKKSASKTTPRPARQKAAGAKQ